MVQELKAQGQWPPALELQSEKAAATWRFIAGKVIELEGNIIVNITHQKKGDVRNQSPLK